MSFIFKIAHSKMSLIMPIPTFTWRRSIKLTSMDYDLKELQDPL